MREYINHTATSRLQRNVWDGWTRLRQNQLSRNLFENLGEIRNHSPHPTPHPPLVIVLKQLGFPKTIQELSFTNPNP